MNTKLTLSIDEELKNNIRKYAKKNHIALSGIVSRHFTSLIAGTKDDVEITTWVKELAGNKKVHTPDNVLKGEYIDYLDNKYR